MTAQPSAKRCKTWPDCDCVVRGWVNGAGGCDKHPQEGAFVVSFKWRDERVLESRFAPLPVAKAFAALKRAEGYEAYVHAPGGGKP